VQHRRYCPRVRDGDAEDRAGPVERTWRDAVEGGPDRAFLSVEQWANPSHYQALYRHGFAPEVLFLVLNDGSGGEVAVNTDLAGWRAKNQEPRADRHPLRS